MTKKKGKWLNRLIVIILILGLGALAFIYLLPKEAKKEFFEEIGIENSDFVKENALSSYVEIDYQYRKNLMGNKWVINGTIWNTHNSAVIRQVKLKVNFSDGSEIVTINNKLNPDPVLRDIFEKRIPGHSGASFLGCEVIEAYE